MAYWRPIGKAQAPPSVFRSRRLIQLRPPRHLTQRRQWPQPLMHSMSPKWSPLSANQRRRFDTAKAFALLPAQSVPVTNHLLLQAL